LHKTHIERKHYAFTMVIAYKAVIINFIFFLRSDMCLAIYGSLLLSTLAATLEANKPNNHEEEIYYHILCTTTAGAHVIQLPGSQIWRYSTLFKGP